MFAFMFVSVHVRLRLRLRLRLCLRLCVCANPFPFSVWLTDNAYAGGVCCCTLGRAHQVVEFPVELNMAPFLTKPTGWVCAPIC